MHSMSGGKFAHLSDRGVLLYITKWNFHNKKYFSPKVSLLSVQMTRKPGRISLHNKKISHGRVRVGVLLVRHSVQVCLRTSAIGGSSVQWWGQIPFGVRADVIL